MEISILEDIMRHLAAGINGVLNDNDMPKGFALIVFDFHEPGVSNYISNASREDMIKSLRETAYRLENNQDIPAVHPTMH